MIMDASGQKKISKNDLMYIQKIEKCLGYTFRDKHVLHAACHVKSMGQRRRNIQFERLEFLGDRVLGLSMAHLLSQKYPHVSEGDLAKKLSALVSKASCQTIADYLDLENALKYFSGQSILHTNAVSDAVEAILGAIMQDSDFCTAESVVKNLWHKFLTGETQAPKDPKTFLQEYTQKYFQTVPLYTILERTGPDHAPFFTLSVMVTGPLSLKPKLWTSVDVSGEGFTVSAQGCGDTRRKAEHNAAENFLRCYIKQAP